MNWWKHRMNCKAFDRSFCRAFLALFNTAVCSNFSFFVWENPCTCFRNSFVNMFAANKLWNSFVGLKPFNTRNMKSIIDQYYPLWFSLASKYTGNYHESEELVEEALAAYVQLRHNNISNPKAYIARTIYHLYIDKIRRQKQNPQLHSICFAKPGNHCRNR